MEQSLDPSGSRNNVYLMCSLSVLVDLVGTWKQFLHLLGIKKLIKHGILLHQIQQNHFALMTITSAQQPSSWKTSANRWQDEIGYISVRFSDLVGVQNHLQDHHVDRVFFFYHTLDVIIHEAFLDSHAYLHPWTRESCVQDMLFLCS